MEARILVPVDGSDTSQRTLQAIIDLKQRFAPTLTLLHVVDTDKLAYRMIPDFQVEMIRENAGKAGELLLQSQVERMEQAGFTIEAKLQFGAPRRVITQVTNDEEFQLLVIGRRTGTGEIRDVLFGSVANYVLHNAKCPVLLF